MSVIAAEVAPRMRIADPKPPYCSTCFRAAGDDVTFVDLGAAYEGPTVTHPETGALIHVMEDIYVCRSCAQEICEVLDLRPELHIKQAREIRRLEVAAEHWEQRAKSLEKVIAQGRPDPVHPPRKRS